MSVKEVLFRLDDFCNANKIEYIVTGTTALAMFGIPSIPHDIDIRVFHLKEEQEAKLNELQFLSGLGKENYKGKCYVFEICGTRINAIVDDLENYGGIALSMADKDKAERRIINVQPVFSALEDKMKLNRPKDKAYLLDLINHLTSL